MSDQRLKVLYIAGYHRSGSTILGNILGEIDGFFHTGELFYLWDIGMLRNWPCACGRPFAECPVWSAVMSRAYGDGQRVDAQEMIRFRDAALRTRDIPLRRLLPGREQRLRLKMDSYLARLDQLYHAIQAVTRCRVIVDSSKSASYACALGMIPGIEVYVLHLVRDPRAVAFSFQKKVNRPELGPHHEEPRIGPSKVALAWAARNYVIPLLPQARAGRYVMINYEAFAREPRRTLSKVFEMIHEDPAELPFVGDHSVRLKGNHIVWGNVSRSRSGTVELKLDDVWQAKMKWSHKACVTAITWPLLARYGR